MRNKKLPNEKSAIDPDMEGVLTELKATPVPPKIRELADELQQKLDERFRKLN